MADAPVITFLSDYGLTDDFVGICHGVIARICPAARVIDLTHGIPRHDVRAGAIVLGEALAYLPIGVHLAVVDPDVGAQRRAIALRLAEVGPDNGLLWPAAVAGGGIAEAGEPLDPADVVVLDLPEPAREGETLVAHVRYIDRFGNLQLNAGHDDLAGTGLKLGRAARIKLPGGTSQQVQFVRTFADAGPDELLLYEDAQRRLAIAVRHGDAADRLELTVDAPVRIRRA